MEYNLNSIKPKINTYYIKKQFKIAYEIIYIHDFNIFKYVNGSTKYQNSFNFDRYSK